MTDACRQADSLEAIEVIVAFGEDERRAAVAYGLDDVVADAPIPRLVVDQSLIERSGTRPA